MLELSSARRHRARQWWRCISPWAGSGLVAIKPLVAALPTPTSGRCPGGGVSRYTAGVLFYRWRSLRYHHALWHLFRARRQRAAVLRQPVLRVALGMNTLVTHRGGCHCGRGPASRSMHRRASSAIECNCSICRTTGVPAPDRAGNALPPAPGRRHDDRSQQRSRYRRGEASILPRPAASRCSHVPRSYPDGIDVNVHCPIDRRIEAGS